MVTKTLVRVSDGAIMSTVAVTAPNDENRNNHQPPKKKDDGSDDKKIVAKEKVVMNHNVSNANNEDDVDNMSTTHVTQTKDEKKSTARGTRRSSRQKRPAVFNDYDDEDTDRDKKKRCRKQGKKKIDLTGVPMQLPILKHDGKKGGLSSKYLGVCWDKSSSKWMTKIMISGKQRHVGYYNNEEDAAADYARAVFKYNGGSDGIDRLRAQQRGKASLEKIDVSDVPMQVPIMKPDGKGNSASKYLGVSFHKAKNKWFAQITIDGKQRYIGYYDNEEDAATDYARAVFKYRGGSAEVKRQDESQKLFNLTKIPAIPPAGYDPLKGGPISALKVTEYEI